MNDKESSFILTRKAQRQYDKLRNRRIQLKAELHDTNEKIGQLMMDEGNRMYL